MSKAKIILTALSVVLFLIYPAYAISPEYTKNSGSSENGDPLLNDLKTLSQKLAWIPCSQGYDFCSESVKSDGDAYARATLSVSYPYEENYNLYINLKCDGDKTYASRSTSWTSNSCTTSGCSAEYLGTGNTYKYLLGKAPSTTQQKAHFTCWSYDGRNGYWAWTAQDVGWMEDWNYDLRYPTPTPTPPPTPPPTPTPTPSPTPTPTPQNTLPGIGGAGTLFIFLILYFAIKRK